MNQKIVRPRLEYFKYFIYISFPVVFGYGLGRIPAFWESVSEVILLEKALDSAIEEARAANLPK
eukprot:gene10594-12259_t